MCAVGGSRQVSECKSELKFDATQIIPVLFAVVWRQHAVGSSAAVKYAADLCSRRWPTLHYCASTRCCPWLFAVIDHQCVCTRGHLRRALIDGALIGGLRLCRLVSGEITNAVSRVSPAPSKGQGSSVCRAVPPQRSLRVISSLEDLGQRPTLSRKSRKWSRFTLFLETLMHISDSVFFPMKREQP